MKKIMLTMRVNIRKRPIGYKKEVDASCMVIDLMFGHDEGGVLGFGLRILKVDGSMEDE